MNLVIFYELKICITSFVMDYKLYMHFSTRILKFQIMDENLDPLPDPSGDDDHPLPWVKRPRTVSPLQSSSSTAPLPGRNIDPSLPTSPTISQKQTVLIQTIR